MPKKTITSKGNTDKNKLNDFAPAFFKAIPAELKTIIDALHRNQCEAYIIGGAVRDYLMGYPVKDYDLTTNARPEQIIKMLTEVGVKTKAIGGKYGTILAIIGKRAFDVSTFRREFFHTPGKPPEVTFTDSLITDLVRRDFTFNAIAFDPINQIFIDQYNGFIDIQKRRIRMIGNPHKSLAEDGLRIIRLARFMSQFNLEVSSELLAATQAIGKHARFRNYIALQKELFKLLMLPNPMKGLQIMWEAEILDSLFPSFPFSKKIETINTFKKILPRFGELPQRNVWIRLFGLLLFLSNELNHTRRIWYSLGQDLRLSARHQQILLRIFRSWQQFPRDFEAGEIKWWIRATGMNTSEDLLELIFLWAEIVGNSELLVKKDLYLNEAQKILCEFRRNHK